MEDKNVVYDSWNSVTGWIELERSINPYYGYSQKDLDIVKEIVFMVKNLLDKNNISHNDDTKFKEARDKLSKIYLQLKECNSETTIKEYLEKLKIINQEKK